MYQCASSLILFKIIRKKYFVKYSNFLLIADYPKLKVLMLTIIFYMDSFTALPIIYPYLCGISKVLTHTRESRRIFLMSLLWCTLYITYVVKSIFFNNVLKIHNNRFHIYLVSSSITGVIDPVLGP